MKIILIICALLCISHVKGTQLSFPGHLIGYDIPPPVGPTIRSDSISTHTFSQKLDHYNHVNTDIWTQRYHVNNEYFKSNVVFLMIGGEGEASIQWMSSGSWIPLAKKYGALLFYLEHRFYGDSHPFTNTSNENLRYLTSQQALADLANFIVGMNEEYDLPDDVKWIAFGGSYSGSLAAWLRQKYPHLVQGAMSASGPIHAQLNFHEYFEVVTDDLQLHSQQCLEVVKTAFSQIDDVLQNSAKENITSIFKLCDNLLETGDNSKNLVSFYGKIADVFAYVAQYNKNVGRTISIDDICETLTNETIGKEIYRLAEVVALITGTGCIQYNYDKIVNALKDITVATVGNIRQWTYQTCTEYGWYQTSDQKKSTFGNTFPLNFFTGMCVDVFGQEFNETYISKRINDTNTYYGGYDIEVSNVVFVHGSIDPWHTMGLTKSRSPDAPVIYINGTAHCANMYDISEDDIPELTAARQQIDELIGKWLGAPSSANIKLPFLLMYIFILMTFLLKNC